MCSFFFLVSCSLPPGPGGGGNCRPGSGMGLSAIRRVNLSQMSFARLFSSTPPAGSVLQPGSVSRQWACPEQATFALAAVRCGERRLGVTRPYAISSRTREASARRPSSFFLLLIRPSIPLGYSASPATSGSCIAQVAFPPHRAVLSMRARFYPASGASFARLFLVAADHQGRSAPPRHVSLSGRDHQRSKTT